MTRALRTTALVLLVLPAISCGRACRLERATLRFDAPGRAEATGAIAKGRVDFYTDFTVQWPDGACVDRNACRLMDLYGAYRYAIEARRGGEVVASLHCDPIQLVVGSGVSIGKTSRSITTDGVLERCAIDFPEDGPTTFRVTLEAVRAGPAKLTRAMLWVMQDKK